MVVCGLEWGRGNTRMEEKKERELRKKEDRGRSVL